MTAIRYACPEHGEVEVQPDDITVFEDLTYSAWCTIGHHGVVKHLDPVIYSLLRGAGVLTFEERVSLEVGIMDRMLDRGVPLD